MRKKNEFYSIFILYFEMWLVNKTNQSNYLLIIKIIEVNLIL